MTKPESPKEPNRPKGSPRGKLPGREQPREYDPELVKRAGEAIRAQADHYEGRRGSKKSKQPNMPGQQDIEELNEVYEEERIIGGQRDPELDI